MFSANSERATSGSVIEGQFQWFDASGKGDEDDDDDDDDDEEEEEEEEEEEGEELLLLFSRADDDVIVFRFTVAFGPLSEESRLRFDLTGNGRSSSSGSVASSSTITSLSLSLSLSLLLPLLLLLLLLLLELDSFDEGRFRDGSFASRLLDLVSSSSSSPAAPSSSLSSFSTRLRLRRRRRCCCRFPPPFFCESLFPRLPLQLSPTFRVLPVPFGRMLSSSSSSTSPSMSLMALNRSVLSLASSSVARNTTSVAVVYCERSAN